jgi:CubicO group peptidase (beta-lactamase class C family)
MRHKWTKRFLSLIVTLLLIHFLVEVTGHHYLYKTLQMTVFQGRLGPDIQEYKNLPKHVIKTTSGRPWPKHALYNQSVLPDSALDFIEEYETVSFLVIYKDSLLFEKYWQGFNDTTISNSFSMAKSIIGVLTGIALDKGYIKSLEDPVYYYLPQYDIGLGKSLKVWHLLSMSSGIDFKEDYLNPFAFPARANYGDNLEALLRNYSVTTTPGVSFNYQSGSTQILGQLLMAATGKSLSELLSLWVWNNIEAEGDAIWSLDADNGEEKAFCCINATATDFARFGKLYLDNGYWNEMVVVDSSYVVASISSAPLVDGEGEKLRTYGYSWWLGEHNGNKIFYMRGIKGQYVLVVPEKDLIVVRMGKKRFFGDAQTTPQDVHIYLDMALKMLP